MSKSTVGAALTLGVAVAVSMIPGAGWGLAIARGAILVASAVVINGVLGPKTPKDPMSPGIQQNVRDSVSPRRLIYGQRRVGGTIVYAGTTDDDNYLHIMLAVAGHEVEAIEDIYLNGKPLSDFDEGGDKKRVNVEWTGQASSTTSVSVVVNGTTYTGSVASIESQIQSAGDFNANSGDAPDPGKESATTTLRLWIETKKVNDTLTVTSSTGTVTTSVTPDPLLYRINTHLGTTTQAADTDAVSEITEWTTDHKLLGIAYIYARFRFDRGAFPFGIPNITALVKGKNDIYNPATTTSGYTTNAALCIADYLCSDTWGLGCSYTTDINTTELASAVTLCDTDVTLEDGTSTEKTYTINGVVDSSSKPKEALEALLTAMAGKISYSAGQWNIYAGAYNSPSISFDEDDLRSGFTLQSKPTRSQLCNAVKGTYLYVDDDKGVQQSSDFPVVTNSTYQTEDGEQIWQDITLPYTNSSPMAQRLAKITLEKARQGMILRYPCKLSALAVKAGDVVNISNTRMGWTDKTFEVTDWQFAIGSDNTLGVDLTLRETASGVFDWSAEETTIDLSPNTNLPSAWDVEPISGLTITESQVISKDGQLVLTAEVEWVASTTRNIRYYEIEGQISGGSNWNRWQTSNTNYEFPNIAAGYGYFVRVRAISGLGVASPWVTKGFQADGVDDTVTPPSNLVVIETIDGLTATWDNNADEEIIAGTEIYAATVNDRSDSSFGLVSVVMGERATYTVAGGTTYYVWIRTKDKFGNTSTYFPASATAGVSGTAATGGGLTAQQEDDLDAAHDMIAGIASDGIVDRAEKVKWQGTWNNLVAESTNIKEQAVAFNYAVEAYKNENNALNTAVFNNWIDASGTLYDYMNDIIDFTDTTTDCTLSTAGTDRATFTSNWDDYLEKRQLLLNAIEASVPEVKLPDLNGSSVIMNGSFEADEEVGYTLLGSASKSTADYHLGSASVRAACISTGSGVRFKVDLPAMQGMKFYCSGWFKREEASLPDDTAKLMVSEIDSSGTTVVSKSVVASVATSAVGWTQCGGVYTVTDSDCDYIIFEAGTTGTTGHWFIDDLFISRTNADMDADVTGDNKAGGIDSPDTRSVNSPPSFYYSKGRGVYSEFKESSTLGVSSGTTYGVLKITVPWNDATGGDVVQQFYPGADVYKRYSSSATVWGSWTKVTDGADVTNDNTAHDVDYVNGVAASTVESRATAAMSAVTDISDDGVFTAGEKQAVLPNWEGVKIQKASIISQAAALGVSHSAYDTAYDTLYNYINPMMADVTSDTNITRTTFNSNWSDYYDEWQKLSNAIADEASKKATWTNVKASDTNAPDDNADVTADSVGDVTVSNFPTGVQNDTLDATLGDLAYLDTAGEATAPVEVYSSGVWIGNSSPFPYGISSTGGATLSSVSCTSIDASDDLDMNANDITACGYIYFSQSATTGTSAATFDDAHKPGSASTNSWMKVYLNGTEYYIPVWS